MAQIGKPKREIYVEPTNMPVPQRTPALPSPKQTPTPVPKKVPA
jgi:hypothetical protein